MAAKTLHTSPHPVVVDFSIFPEAVWSRRKLERKCQRSGGQWLVAVRLFLMWMLCYVHDAAAASLMIFPVVIIITITWISLPMDVQKNWPEDRPRRFPRSVLTKTQDTHTLTKNRFHKIFFLALKSIVLRYPKKITQKKIYLIFFGCVSTVPEGTIVTPHVVRARSSTTLHWHTICKQLALLQETMMIFWS